MGDTLLEQDESTPRWMVPPMTRWAYVAPALGAFLFVGHAWEDSGPTGAAPYALALLLSVVSIVRPTLLAWLALAILYGAYLVLMIAAVAEPIGEWLVFVMVGAVPSAALWWARPRRVKGAGEAVR